MPGSNYDPRTGTITGEEESKWFVPEERLNREQRPILRRILQELDNNHNVWLKGFAGSGKSVLLVHVALKILTSRPNAKIVIIVYTQSLVEMFKRALRELKMRIDVITYFRFMDSYSAYDYILCDEVQDLTPRVLNRMYERAAHIVVAGDSNQSIFLKDPRWGENTVEISQIPNLIHLQNEGIELTIIERLTEYIVKAVRAFTGLNIFGGKPNTNVVNSKIYLCSASSLDSEVSYVIKNSTRVVQRGYTAAILIPTQKGIVEFVNLVLTSQGKPIWNSTTNGYGRVDFGAMNNHLASCGIKMQYVGNGYGQFKDNPDYVVLMTYHSAKGLDFDYVYIPYCNNYLWISYDANKSRTLFMVAMTRARMNLYITYTGNLHSYAKSFANEEISIQRTI